MCSTATALKKSGPAASTGALPAVAGEVGAQLKGKIVVVLINDPDFETGSGDFGGKAMTYYGRWTYKYEIAAKQGAGAAVIIHETEP